MNVCQTGVSVRAAACVRAIDRDLSCRVTNDRMKYMTTHRPDCAGKSLLELLWDQLMEAYADLVAWKPIAVDPDHPDWMNQDDAEDRGRHKGACLGFATAIAIITNPYAPDVDAVRKEAAERYEAMG